MVLSGAMGFVNFTLQAGFFLTILYALLSAGERPNLLGRPFPVSVRNRFGHRLQVQICRHRYHF